ncbi:hypothetical protein CRE_23972 [Caenorhabditis remanei]|uniref:Uncharacterized protein n=2 Tax=Caenorhabditis remanei TaxID=31234 RepID=E3MG86_CAERE|nr:hypothetical protein CRE_23972 [Caenorhabditis remanei]
MARDNFGNDQTLMGGRIGMVIRKPNIDPKGPIIKGKG